MLQRPRLGLTAFSLFIAFTSAASAAPAANTAAAKEAKPIITAAAKTSVEGGEPLPDAELNGLRGGHAISIANQTLTSIAEGNSIGGNVSAGGVNLSDNALSSFNGLGNIVINTGSQVSVQSGMNVTITVNQ